MHQRSSKLHGRRTRGGAVAVETAITLPVLLLVVFASIEFARAHSLLHTTENAAYEAARRGIVPGATARAVKKKAKAILGAVGARNARVTVTPSTITPTTEEITVDIRVPMNSNGFISGMFFKDKSLKGHCKLRREQYAQTSVP
jgi:Flp pilus assembly protein TadG